MGELMQGKRVLVTGVRNKWSIAWHTAEALHREGARVAFSVFGEREEAGLRKLLTDSGMEDAPIAHCNATDEAQAVALMETIGAAFEGELDGLVHAIAFANRDDLAGEYVNTSREGFSVAHENSVYTMVSLARAARPLMNKAGGGSLVTLTYLGAERVVPNYNVMGVAKAALEASVRYLATDLGKENIRVNAVSAGPIKTLSASGISGFDGMVKHVAEHSPLRRAVTPDEVGDAVLFLLSNLARGITGETLYVDAGYHTMGM